jgi:protein NDRG1
VYFNFKDSSFRDWIACPEMKGLRDRIKWIHVDLPGQEFKAKEITVQYPTIDEMSEELVIILDELKINQVIGLGEGCGANIIARFGMIHPNRCLGVALIHPTGNTATFMQNLREKFLTNMLPSSTHDSYLVWHKFGHVIFSSTQFNFSRALFTTSKTSHFIYFHSLTHQMNN